MASPTADDLLPYVSRIFAFDPQLSEYPCCNGVECEECIAYCAADPASCSILNLFYSTEDSQIGLDTSDVELWYSFYEYTTALFPRSKYPEFYI